VERPRLIDLYMNKQIELDELVTRTYSLDQVNEAMTALERGRGRTECSRDVEVSSLRSVRAAMVARRIVPSAAEGRAARFLTVGSQSAHRLFVLAFSSVTFRRWRESSKILQLRLFQVIVSLHDLICSHAACG
jgi:hypothetical protein